MKKEEVLELIAKVRQYSETTLGLPIKAFREFSDDERTYTWVYASEKDSLKTVLKTERGRPFKFFENSEAADSFAEEMRKKYDVYVFNGEASSGDSKITPGFFKSKFDRKVSVIIHECIHDFISDNDLNYIPYDLNEALATHIGHYAGWKFCETHYPEHAEEAKLSMEYFSEYAKLITTYKDMFQVYYLQGPFDREAIFEAFEREVKLVKKKYKSERKEGEINNAFFIRSIDYCITLPVVEDYFRDRRRTIRGLFNAPKKKRREKLEFLMQQREKHLAKRQESLLLLHSN